MSRLIVTTSWDDGSIQDLKLGELLMKYGIKGTFYIPRSSKRITPMQKVDLLDWLRGMKSAPTLLIMPILH